MSAMRNLNGFEIGGRTLRVDTACTEKSRIEMQSLMTSQQQGERFCFRTKSQCRRVIPILYRYVGRCIRWSLRPSSGSGESTRVDFQGGGVPTSRKHVRVDETDEDVYREQPSRGKKHVVPKPAISVRSTASAGCHEVSQGDRCHSDKTITSPSRSGYAFPGS